MEMCARKYMFGECAGKYMFGDKSTFDSSQNCHNLHKKGQQEFFFCTLNKGQLSTLNVKKVLHFTFPLKICTFFKGIKE